MSNSFALIQDLSADTGKAFNHLSKPAGEFFNEFDFPEIEKEPYRFKTDPKSDFGKKLHVQDFINGKIRNATAPHFNEHRERMIEASDETLTYADYFHDEIGDVELAEEYFNLALNFADVALGFVPILGQVYGFASDGYHLIFGNHMLTGETLSTSDRVIAGVSLISAGLLSRGVKILKGLPILAESATLGIKGGSELADLAKLITKSPASKEIVEKGAKWGFKHGDEMAEHADVIGKLGKGKVNKLEHADDVNASFIKSGDQPPYKAGTKIVNFTTTDPEIFVRVHGPGNQARPWVMRAEDIEGLSAAQIQAKYNLPNVPTKVSEVKVPAVTEIRSGMIGKNKFGNSEGAVQYEIIMPEGKSPPDHWFEGIGNLD